MGSKPQVSPIFPDLMTRAKSTSQVQIVLPCPSEGIDGALNWEDIPGQLQMDAIPGHQQVGIVPGPHRRVGAVAEPHQVGVIPGPHQVGVISGPHQAKVMSSPSKEEVIPRASQMGVPLRTIQARIIPDSSESSSDGDDVAEDVEELNGTSNHSPSKILNSRLVLI